MATQEKCLYGKRIETTMSILCLFIRLSLWVHFISSVEPNRLINLLVVQSMTFLGLRWLDFLHGLRTVFAVRPPPLISRTTTKTKTPTKMWCICFGTDYRMRFEPTKHKNPKANVNLSKMCRLRIFFFLAPFSFYRYSVAKNLSIHYYSSNRSLNAKAVRKQSTCTDKWQISKVLFNIIYRIYGDSRTNMK